MSPEDRANLSVVLHCLHSKRTKLTTTTGMHGAAPSKVDPISYLARGAAGTCVGAIIDNVLPQNDIRCKSSIPNQSQTYGSALIGWGILKRRG
jgi:hypothetical protein